MATGKYGTALGPSDVWDPEPIDPMGGVTSLNPLGLNIPGAVPLSPRSPAQLVAAKFDPLSEFYLPKVMGAGVVRYHSSGGAAPDALPLPYAERKGVVIHPSEFAARVASGKFDPLKDMYMDPVRGPLPFAITMTEIEGGREEITFSPYQAPAEYERAKQRRIASYSQGARSTRLASLSEYTRQQTALSGGGRTLGAGSPQLGARAGLSALS